MRVRLTAILGVALLGFAGVVAQSRSSTGADASTSGARPHKIAQPKRLPLGGGALSPSKSLRVSQKMSSDQLIRRAEIIGGYGNYEAAVEVAELAVERAPECENAKRVLCDMIMARALSASITPKTPPLDSSGWRRIFEEALTRAEMEGDLESTRIEQVEAPDAE
jgi:hypothetical protein